MNTLIDSIAPPNHSKDMPTLDENNTSDNLDNTESMDVTKGNVESEIKEVENTSVPNSEKPVLTYVQQIEEVLVASES